MPEKKDSDLVRLIRTFGITFGPPSEMYWPPSHRPTFEDIRRIQNQKFDDYCVKGDIFHNQPCLLIVLRQRRNEAGWKLVLKSEILRRLYVEVAW
jgi:hypothetical protein